MVYYVKKEFQNELEQSEGDFEQRVIQLDKMVVEGKAKVPPASIHSMLIKHFITEMEKKTIM